MLRGARGKPPCDVRAAVDAIVSFSRFAHGVRETVAAVEINPLIVASEGAIGVDLVIEPYPAGA